MSEQKSRAERGPPHSPDVQASLCLTPSTSSAQASAFRFQIEAAARDLGRLRRRVNLEHGDYASHLVERVGNCVETIDALVWPTAGELHRRGLSVDEALHRADARAAKLRGLLGKSSR
jgi:hypothetical protein